MRGAAQLALSAVALHRQGQVGDGCRGMNYEPHVGVTDLASEYR
jgi:hypothetical protein